jgi:hypothetical protein
MNSTPSTKKSFLELIKEFSIVVPSLQRDYAQGRTDESEKLDGFLSFLKDSIVKNKKANLDFVFGYYQEVSNVPAFVPIDGQQRLTTIFLLHWYLAIRSGRYEDFKSAILLNGQSKFSYQTRLSSKQFILELISNGVPESILSSKNSMSEVIEDCGWFYRPWSEDSTVNAILNAINAIHTAFGTEATVGNFYAILENGLISFEFLNPEEIQLSDEFYIKMNARGLPLTQFENFKADFIDTLSEKLPAKKDEFANNLDGAWSDTIWNWSVKSGNYYDDSFRNVLSYLFRICFSQAEEKDNAYKFELSKHYKELLNQSNYDFIAAVLDLLQPLYSHCKEDNAFDSKQNKLFERLINSEPSHHESILLYGVLKYQLKYGLKSNTDEYYRDFIRVVENILVNTNQSKKDMFTTDLRPIRYKELLGIVDDLIKNEDPYKSLVSIDSQNQVIGHEIEKARCVHNNPQLKASLQKLEEHPYLQGCLRNFMFLFEEPAQTENLVELFYTLWDINSNTDLQLYTALFSLGDYVVHVGNSGLGGQYYVGKIGYWHRVLANTNREESEVQIQVFRNLFSHLTNCSTNQVFERLHQIALPESNDWKYYLAKYPKILEGYELFAFEDSNCNTAKIELMTGTILSAWHTGYLNRAVELELKKQNDDRVISTGINSVVWSSISIDDFKFDFNGNQWRILKGYEELKDNPKVKYHEDEKNYFINSTEGDLVQELILFIEESTR